MIHRESLSNLGIHVYGSAAILLGVIGLTWGDFATVWQPIQALPFTLPHQRTLAYLVAISLLLAGVAVQHGRTARAGVAALAILYFLFNASLWVPRVIGHPLIYGTWGGFFEQFSLVAAALVAFSSLPSRDAPYSRPNIARIGRVLYGVCVVSYGLEHFSALPQTASMVPKWIPPGQQFWAAATGAAFLLAGIAILSGILAVLASRLLTAMIVSFGVLVWLPSVIAQPHEHMVWAGNAINLAAIGAAWVVADFMSRQEQAESLRTEPPQL